MKQHNNKNLTFLLTVFYINLAFCRFLYLFIFVTKLAKFIKVINFLWSDDALLVCLHKLPNCIAIILKCLRLCDLRYMAKFLDCCYFIHSLLANAIKYFLMLPPRPFCNIFSSFFLYVYYFRFIKCFFLLELNYLKICFVNAMNYLVYVFYYCCCCNGSIS